METVASPASAMTAGVDPENSPEEKQCNDGFKTSKRFKRVSRDTSGSVDLVFDVAGVSSLTGNVYRIFEKYENLSPNSIEGFTVELGTGIGSSFDDAVSGISFVKQNGQPLNTVTVNCEEQNINLAAFFAFGLFGDAATNSNQDLNGYYDPTDCSCFALNVVSPTKISTGSLLGKLPIIYGTSWVSKAQAPIGFFYDIDNRPSTDNLLVGDWNGVDWVTRLSCNSPIFKELSKKNRMEVDECVDYDAASTPASLSEDTITK